MTIKDCITIIAAVSILASIACAFVAFRAINENTSSSVNTHYDYYAPKD